MEISNPGSGSGDSSVSSPRSPAKVFALTVVSDPPQGQRAYPCADEEKQRIYGKLGANLCGEDRRGDDNFDR